VRSEAIPPFLSLRAFCGAEGVAISLLVEKYFLKNWDCHGFPKGSLAMTEGNDEAISYFPLYKLFPIPLK